MTADDLIERARAAAGGIPAKRMYDTDQQALIGELADALENERARGIHTCHDQCQRPLCVAGRRIRELERQHEDGLAAWRANNSHHAARIAALHAALRTYGWHTPECDYIQEELPCTCGFLTAAERDFPEIGPLPGGEG